MLIPEWYCYPCDELTPHRLVLNETECQRCGIWRRAGIAVILYAAKQGGRIESPDPIVFGPHRELQAPGDRR